MCTAAALVLVSMPETIKASGGHRLPVIAETTGMTQRELVLQQTGVPLEL